MKTRPEFTVIASPNGAGKSRLSSYYIHCNSFDGDLLALNLRKEHPEWQEHWISGTVAGELPIIPLVGSISFLLKHLKS